MPAYGEKISATELARNLSSIIDKVRISRTHIIITKRNQNIAELIPAHNQGFPAAKLAEFLKDLALGPVDQKEFSADLDLIRKESLLPDSPWES
ncbi:MAG: type II toxin-antitoxin system prevent-host-death family antitoxin [Thermodesulfobacteriota bacterium]|nr:type II toxin-antitoxin system prevent-host-death family antitoxin [Thermodesulfobacteriota bacterium]